MENGTSSIGSSLASPVHMEDEWRKLLIPFYFDSMALTHPKCGLKWNDSVTG
jgi:hypothetical protein